MTTTVTIDVLNPDTTPYAYAVVSVRLVDAGTGGVVTEGVVTGTQQVFCDEDGHGTIALTPNASIDPAGTFYAFAVENSSPATVRKIEVPVSPSTIDWADDTYHVLPTDDPPVFIPAPTLATVGYVPTVNGTGDGFELVAGGSGTTTSVGALIHSATSKATPVDADEIALADSAASWVLKKLTWANLKATAKTYFDTLYSALGHVHAGSDITSGTIGTARLGSGTANSGTYLRGDQTWAAAGATTVDVVSNVATSTILGRTTAGSGDSEELTPSATMGLLSGSAAASFSVNSQKITAVGTPTASTDGATKGYVDGFLSSLHFTGAGKLIQPNPMPGLSPATGGQSASGAGITFALPLWIDSNCTLAAIMCRVPMLEASSYMRLGIYSATYLPATDLSASTTTKLLDLGTVSGASAGNVRLAGTQALTPGPHLLVGAQPAGYTTVRWTRVNVQYAYLGFNSATNYPYSGWFVATDYSAGLPSSLPAMTLVAEGSTNGSLPFLAPEFT